MNTSFRNSNIGFILYTLIIVIITGVFLITVWYMMWGYRLGTYSEGTVIGSVYLGGLQEDELEEKVNSKIDIWLGDPTIVFELTYQEYSYQFDRNLIYFDLDESKNILVDGTQNELVARYQLRNDDDDFLLVVEEINELEFLEDVIDNVNVELLVNDILDDAGMMKTYSSKKIEEYLITPEDSYTDISSVSIPVPEGVDIDLLIQKLNAKFGTNGLVFNSQTLFDIVDELSVIRYEVEGEETREFTMSDIEMTLLAQAMLKLSHETNFAIHEVHYLPRYDVGNYTFETFHFGSNVTVNQPDEYSFSMYNPNDSNYTFRVEDDLDNPGNIVVTLYGLEFVNDIEAQINIVELPYYTAFTDNPLLLQDGEVGAVVTVRRIITDMNENVLFDQDILFEYYQPKSEILLDE